MMLIVPNWLSASINRALDVALAECPEAAPDRELFYEKLLAYFNEYGKIPDFALAKREDA